METEKLEIYDPMQNPKTTFLQDFLIAIKVGKTKSAVEDTFKRCFNEWKDDIVYLCELSYVTNYFCWQYEHNQDWCEMFSNMYYKCMDYEQSCEKFTQEEHNWFFDMTD